MSLFGLIVVFVCVWWVVFFAALPIGVSRQKRVAEGHDPGAPAEPMLLKKALWTTAITSVFVGAAAVFEAANITDIGAWFIGLPS
ncbi:MAG: DUF1467 family protein [Alphaproteobacteria bacterium]|nr:DUF1467 family protein [Alphaproteobacteria bacterium]